VKGTKTQTSKKEGRESKNPDTIPKYLGRESAKEFRCGNE
jgi:hypothetical protein